jgi:hypothetical protein
VLQLTRGHLAEVANYSQLQTSICLCFGYFLAKKISFSISAGPGLDIASIFLADHHGFPSCLPPFSSDRGKRQTLQNPALLANSGGCQNQLSIAATAGLPMNASPQIVWRLGSFFSSEWRFNSWISEYTGTQFDRRDDFSVVIFWTIYTSTDRPCFHSVWRKRDKTSFPARWIAKRRDALPIG